jgi:hypothetical protein
MSMPFDSHFAAISALIAESMRFALDPGYAERMADAKQFEEESNRLRAEYDARIEAMKAPEYVEFDRYTIEARHSWEDSVETEEELDEKGEWVKWSDVAEFLTERGIPYVEYVEPPPAAQALANTDYWNRRSERQRIESELARAAHAAAKSADEFGAA